MSVWLKGNSEKIVTCGIIVTCGTLAADNWGQAVSIRFCSREGTALTKDSWQNKNRVWVTDNRYCLCSGRLHTKPWLFHLNCWTTSFPIHKSYKKVNKLQIISFGCFWAPIPCNNIWLNNSFPFLTSVCNSRRQWRPCVDWVFPVDGVTEIVAPRHCFRCLSDSLEITLGLIYNTLKDGDWRQFLTWKYKDNYGTVHIEW